MEENRAEDSPDPADLPVGFHVIGPPSVFSGPSLAKRPEIG
jgi:hypothetical protein